MPLPGDVNTITVTGTHVDISGSPKTGTVEFTLATSLVDSTDHIVVAAGTYPAALVSGTYSIILPCTDNSVLSPSGFSYSVTEQFNGGRPAYSVQLPHTLGATVDDSTLAAVSPLPPVSTVYGVLAASNVWTGALNDFTGSRITVSTPTSASHAANKSYVDAAVGGSGSLLVVNNLSDLASAGTARSNLGLGGAALLSVGTSAGTVAAGNDSRFTDPVVAAFSVAGTLTVAAYDFRWYNDTGRTLTFGSIRASVGVPSSGASIIADLLVNGSTAFSSSANRPTVTSGSNTALSGVPNTTALTSGSYLTTSVIQVGSSVAGSDLTIQVSMS